MSLYHQLEQQGLLYQCSSQQVFEKYTQTPGQVAYCGFDCTADSFHVGNLAVMMLLRKWQQAGHKPVILLGGGTTLIGDPSGKDKTRQLLNAQTIESNKASLRKTFEKLLDFNPENPNAAVIVDNAHWLGHLKMLEFMRDIGPHLTVNRLMTFDSIKSRLEREQPLTYLEFNYMLMQAYDFYYLSENENVSFQFGGSDQWGNMICGMELTRKITGKQNVVFTIPLLTTADGKKMGKTESGAIWLNEDKYPDFDYWQFWRNCHDDDVVRFLHIYTDLSVDAIENLSQEHKDNPNPLKEILANQATGLIRSEQSAEQCAKAAKALFSSQKSPVISEDLTSFEVTQDDKGSFLVDFLVAHQLFSSKSACRKMIEQGAVKIDGVKLTNTHLTLADLSSLEAQTQCLLSIGKKKHYRLFITKSS